MISPSGRPRVLVVGGCGGLVGRAFLPEFANDWQIRSVHRHPVASEAPRGVEWVAQDATQVADWAPLLREVHVVVTLAWYRQGPARVFAPLAAGLCRLIEAAARANVRRFLHVSVPAAPASLEEGLPYLSYKRVVDRALASSGLPHTTVHPTMLFGPNDRLLTVILRLMHRYHRFPMFGDGEYHVSPIAVEDLARILRREAAETGTREVIAGGPVRFRYRDLTDRMFRALGRPPRYVRLSPRTSVWVAATLERLGSSLLYAYEVEWLLSDLLGLPPYEGLGRPLTPVEPFLEREAARLGGPATAVRG